MVWLVALSLLLNAVLGTDRFIAALKRVLRVPQELNAEILTQAKRIVEEDIRERRYSLLAEKADLILAELVPNGGASLRDAISRIEAKLDAHLEETEPLIAEHHAMKRAVEAHISLHLDGSAT